MSMENAIQAHADALNNLAEAIRAAFGGGAPLLLGHLGAEPIGTAEVKGDTVTVKAGAEEDTKQAKARANKKADKAPDAKGDTEPLKGDAEVEKAVEKVEADATGKADEGDEAALDYVKDVRPTLLAAIKTHGKEKVQAIIAEFGVAKADLIEPAKLPELLEKVGELDAGV